MKPEKKELRDTKRSLKKAGNKKRRGKLKQQLRDDPDEAHTNEPSVGKYSSEPFNGMIDNDRTRKRNSEEKDEDSSDS